MKHHFQSSILQIVLLIALTSVGCGKSGPKVILADNTKIPEKDSTFQAVSVEQNKLTFTYLGPASASNVQVGDILVGGTGGGYLRKVESLDIQGNILTAQTSQASLEDAVKEGRLQFVLRPSSSNSLISSPVHGSIRQPLSGPIDLSGKEIFDGSIGGVNVRVEIVQGQISFTPEFPFDVDIGLLGLKRFSAIASGRLDLSLDIMVTVSGSLNGSKEIDIVIPAIYPFGFALGPLPVVGHFELAFKAGFDINAAVAGSVTVGFDVSTAIKVGAEYSNGSWRTVWDPSLSGNVHPVQWGLSGDVDVRAYLKPQLKTIFYSIAGPSLSLEPYLLWKGVFLPRPASWELKGGLRGNLGFHVEVFRKTLAEYEVELFDWNTKLGDGTIPIGQDGGTPFPDGGIIQDGGPLTPDGGPLLDGGPVSDGGQPVPDAGTPTVYDDMEDNSIDSSKWTLKEDYNSENGTGIGFSEQNGKIGTHSSFSYSGDHASFKFNTYSNTAVPSFNFGDTSGIAIDSYLKLHFKDSCFGEGYGRYYLIDQSANKVMFHEFVAAGNGINEEDTIVELYKQSSTIWNVYKGRIFQRSVDVSSLVSGEKWAVEFHTYIASGSGCSNSAYMDIWIDKLSYFL